MHAAFLGQILVQEFPASPGQFSEIHRPGPREVLQGEMSLFS